jgi:hypothetical protein
MYKGAEFLIKDFSGGYSGATPSTSIDMGEALNLQNVVISVGGAIDKRRGNTVFNSSAMASGAAVTGLEAFKLSTGNEYLMATAGTKLYQGITSGTTMTDITGAITITSSQNNLWTISQLNDLAIGVGGAPDAPWKWTGAGNAAVLGGTPPNGNFGFQHNNRMFIGNTAANPSTIYWSVLGDPEDWASAGSGSQNVDKNDGDTLVGHAILSNDLVLLFKQRSIHKLIGRSAPFPVSYAFRGPGAVGKKAIVVADGLVYFITPYGRMKITDGNVIISDEQLPKLRYADDLWNGLNQSRLQYIVGQHYVGNGFNHIIWSCSSGSGSTNGLAIIWDIKNKCWLQHTTGYTANALCRTQNGNLYMGAYDGKIYLQDVASTYTDASEASPGTINAYWSSGWMHLNSLRNIKHPSQLRAILLSQTAGNISIGYGFDFSMDKVIVSKSMQSPGGLWDVDQWDVGLWGGQSDIVRTILTVGRGNVFQFSVRQSDPNISFRLHGVSISGEESGQKVFEAA